MSKRILVTSSLVLIVLIVGIAILFYADNDKVIIESGKNNSIARSNALTMMYETGYQTGEYQVASDNAWPRTDIYTFNAELSRCENGSKIYWNSETNRVMMEATTADKCYVYFYAKLNMQINDIYLSSTHNSITVSVTDVFSNNEISSYHYSINDNEYVLSNSNEYSFTNLASNTNYNIKVYITDVNGNVSNIFSAKTITGSNHYVSDYTFEDFPADKSASILFLDSYYMFPEDYWDIYNVYDYMLQNERRKYASSENITTYLGEIVDYEGNPVLLEDILEVSEDELMVSDFTIMIIENVDEYFGKATIEIMSDTIYDIEDTLFGVFIAFSGEINNNGEMTKVNVSITPPLQILSDYGEIVVEDIPPEIIAYSQENFVIFLIVSS